MGYETEHTGILVYHSGHSSKKIRSEESFAVGCLYSAEICGH